MLTMARKSRSKDAPAETKHAGKLSVKRGRRLIIRMATQTTTKGVI